MTKTEREKVERLRKQCALLEAIVGSYAEHSYSCDWRGDGDKCSCGLEKALEKARL